jgi:hypothetical protein
VISIEAAPAITVSNVSKQALAGAGGLDDRGVDCTHLLLLLLVVG